MQHRLRLRVCSTCILAAIFLIVITWSVHEKTVSFIGRSPKEAAELSANWQKFMQDSLRDAKKLKEGHAYKKSSFLFEATCKDKCALNASFATHLNASTLAERISLLEPDMSHKIFNASRILILTPMKDTADIVHNYYSLLKSINYDHRLVSVSIGVDPSSNRTLNLLHSLPWSETKFEKVQILSLAGGSGYAYGRAESHKESLQRDRRMRMAKARNELLARAIGDHDYVLWVDADVLEWPPDIIQHLIDAQKDVVVPACMYRNKHGSLSLYDRNSWQETRDSIEYQATFDERGDSDVLVLEGYSKSRRLYISDLRGTDRLVPLDGVGGCVLMVRASCHKEGLVFPPFVFRHHIETEGLAKMAQSMGHGVYGLPYLQVIHS